MVATSLVGYPVLAEQLLAPPGPSEVRADWKRPVRWRCPQGHTWVQSVRSRVQWAERGAPPSDRAACPFCWEAPTSEEERWLARELGKRLGDVRTGQKVEIRHKVYDLDIVIARSRGGWLVVEYDGWYYHKGREARDLARSRALERELPACRVIRVREEPLDEGRRHWQRYRHWVWVPSQRTSRDRPEMLRLVLEKIAFFEAPRVA